MQTVATRKAAYGRQVRDTIRNHLLKTLYLRDLYKEWPKAPHTGAWVSYNEWRKIKLALWDFSMHLKQPVPEIDLEVPRHEVHDYLKLGRYVDEDEKPLRKLTRSLNEQMKGLGWYVRKAFRNSQHYILYLSPVEYAPQAVPRYLYHFSSLPNKERILRKGLLPKIGRYDMDFMYPPRVHCLTELDLTYLRALAFNIFNHGDMPSIETIYHGGAAAYEMPLVIFRVDTTKLRKGTKFYKDPSVKNGVWTYTHVPPEALAVEHEDVFSEESSVSIRKQAVVAINDDMADWWIPDTPKMKLTPTPKPAAVPTPQATPPELEDLPLIETRKATTAPPTEGELKLLRQFGNLAAYNEARSGSDQDKKDYLVAKWKKINQALFEGKLEPCKIIFVKDRGVKFKMRGQWNSRTRNLKMHPRCFNAGEEILLETLTHEMCVDGSALISTDVGLVRMDQVTELKATQVLTRRGRADIIKHWRVGTKRVFTVETATGSTVSLTSNHPVLVFSSDCRFVWKEVSELSRGDFLLQRLGRDFELADTSLAYAQEALSQIGYCKVTSEKFPSKMTSKLARLLGYLTAEGSFVEGRNPNTIHFSNSKDDVLEDYARCWEACFGDLPFFDRSSLGKHRVIVTTRKDVANWLIAVGFPRGLSPTRRVPHCILEAPSKYIKHYLRAFIEGDGSLTCNRIEMVSSSYFLLKDVKSLLATLGLVSTLCPKQVDNSFTPVGGGNYWTLRTLDGVKPMKTIGVVSAVRRAKLESLLDRTSRKVQYQLGKQWKVPFVFDWVSQETAISGRDLRRLANGFLYPSGVAVVLGKDLTSLQRKRVSRVVGPYIFDPIVSITKGEKVDVYDMETSKGEFVADGFVVHNCHQAVTDISKLRVQEINKGHGPVWESWMRACGLSANRYDRYGNDTYLDDTETERKENYTKQVDKTQSEWTSRKDLQPGVVVEFLMPKKQATVIGVIAGESISKSKGTVLHRYVVLVDPFKGTTWLVPRMGLNLYRGANVDMYKKPLWAKKVASLLKYYPMSEVEDD